MVYTSLDNAYANLNMTCFDNMLSDNELTGKPLPINLTGVICTIGPASSTEEKLTAMLQSGMRIARLNFSHGDHESHGKTIKLLKELRAKLNRPFAIALDTKGPEIRTGDLDSEKSGGKPTVEVVKGSEITFTNDRTHFGKCSANFIYCDYPSLDQMEVGQLIYIEDGLMQFKVAKKVDAHTLMCTAMNGGDLGSRKGVNLPNVKVNLPAMTEQDKKDLAFGVQQGVDMIFASFIRSAEHVREIKAHLKQAGDEKNKIAIIPKIENQEGLDNFDAILKEVEGVMAARGDMGIETRLETVPLKQKAMSIKCNRAQIPYIVATQMLESMIKNPRATRAEVYDVSGAVLDGASCVMLSGESAKGSYPVEAVKTQAKVATSVESVLSQLSGERVPIIPKHPAETLARACKSPFIVLMCNGTPDENIPCLRSAMPNTPVVVLGTDDIYLHQSNLFRAMLPYKIDSAKINCEKHCETTKYLLGEAVAAYKMYTGNATVGKDEKIVMVCSCPGYYNISIQTLASNGL